MILELILGNDFCPVPINVYLPALLVVGKHLHHLGQQLMKKLHSSFLQMQRIRQLDEHTFNKPHIQRIRIKWNKHNSSISTLVLQNATYRLLASTSLLKSMFGSQSRTKAGTCSPENRIKSWGKKKNITYFNLDINFEIVKIVCLFCGKSPSEYFYAYGRPPRKRHGP